jgi:hypothetical protein
VVVRKFSELSPADSGKISEKLKQPLVTELLVCAVLDEKLSARPALNRLTDATDTPKYSEVTLNQK